MRSEHWAVPVRGSMCNGRTCRIGAVCRSCVVVPAHADPSPDRLRLQLNAAHGCARSTDDVGPQVLPGHLTCTTRCDEKMRADCRRRSHPRRERRGLAQCCRWSGRWHHRRHRGALRGADGGGGAASGKHALLARPRPSPHARRARASAVRVIVLRRSRLARRVGRSIVRVPALCLPGPRYRTGDAATVRPLNAGAPTARRALLSYGSEEGLP